MIIGPELLSAQAQRKHTKVFLCGPGIGGANFSTRQFARDTLESVASVDVHFGEDIEGIANFTRRSRDLQTLELEFAHSVDYTLLLLESPGSIAELGTFSMVENVRGRLVVLVPSRFYGDSSYIARGPLSLLSRQFESNVIYYENHVDQNLKKRILYPLTLYKFAHYKLGWRYYQHRNHAYRSREYGLDSYENFISETRRDFSKAATYIGILILGSPTFPELIASTALSPSHTSDALHLLYQEDKISKDRNGRYSPLAGFDDAVLDGFSSTAISNARAEFVAGLDRRMAS